MMRAASNSMLMPTAAPPGPAYWGLCFTAETAGATIAMAKQGTGAPAVSLETSTDGETWTPFVIGTTTITLANVGDRVFFRAGDGGTGGDGVNVKFALRPTLYNKFVMTGTIAASGDISSILDRSGTVLSFAASESLAVRSYVFMNLFIGCASLTAAPELPATTLADYCYYSMFESCDSLTAAPKLPATTLARYCYYRMFYGCDSLTAAPELPATTLAGYCYYYMFYSCDSLTAAPELPATTLAGRCYYRMFYNCTSLTAAPELPATTLADYCYTEMFRGCTALAWIKVCFTAWSNATLNWFLDASMSGIFACPAALGTDETIERGDDRCPEGWTVINN